MRYLTPHRNDNYPSQNARSYQTWYHSAHNEMQQKISSLNIFITDNQFLRKAFSLENIKNH